MDSILSVLATIAIIFGVVMLFNFMIFIHELGHFFAARWRGLYVDRFQIWFGRPIWKKTVNGVQWGLGWMWGESRKMSQKYRALITKLFYALFVFVFSFSLFQQIH